ncbi:holo-ACP synthase [bacterium]|nr:holo-ACP synthase [bacterium]
MIAGVGTDIVEVERFKDKPELWNRFLSEKEHAYIGRFKFKEEHIAGFWAAKEALVKALNKRDFNFSWITIAHDENGKPFFEFDRFEIEGKLHLSISHERKFATAVVIWEK